MQVVRQTDATKWGWIFQWRNSTRDALNPRQAIGEPTIASEFMTGCQAPPIRCLPEMQPQARMGVGLTFRQPDRCRLSRSLDLCQSIVSSISRLPNADPK